MSLSCIHKKNSYVKIFINAYIHACTQSKSSGREEGAFEEAGAIQKKKNFATMGWLRLVDSLKL